MPVLAIETATACVGCALWADDGPLAMFELVAGRRHAEVLMPAVDDLCRRAGVLVADLDGVAVDVGPGLFTGLRVGVATAAAIAQARGLPWAGVTSLDALAHPLRRRPGLVAAIVDARRAEVYWALYRSDGATLRQLVGPAVATPEAVAAAWEELDEGLLAVGDGAWRYREVFAAAGAEVASRAEMWPSPLVIAELGAQRLASGDAGVATGHAGAAVGDAGSTVRGPSPLYLRQADVRIGWDQVDGRVGPVVPGAGAG